MLVNETIFLLLQLLSGVGLGMKPLQVMLLPHNLPYVWRLEESNAKREKLRLAQRKITQKQEWQTLDDIMWTLKFALLPDFSFANQKTSFVYASVWVISNSKTPE